MAALLLALIYLAFISLGLPDSLLGSSWPVMHVGLDVPLSSLGIVTMLISFCTIISALFSDKLNRKFKTQWVIVLSVVLTCLGLFGFSFAPNFGVLLLFTIPYGLGAGAIDSSLNNYVALHYSSRQMSWLHCFWGVGTIISPYIMTLALTNFNSYQVGYRLVGLVQAVIAGALFLSLPLWSKIKAKEQVTEAEPRSYSFKEKFKIKHIFFLLFGFLAYCAVESTVMAWSSTYMVEVKNIEPTLAVSFASLFFIGMTVGRFLSGFVTNKLGDKLIIRIGQFIAILGIIIISLPISNIVFTVSGFVVIGLGCAPIFPGIIHSTPLNFSKEKSQAVIGLQMASAYIGSTFIPPVFGLIAEHISCALFPVFLVAFLVLSIVLLEVLNYRIKKDNRKNEKN